MKPLPHTYATLAVAGLPDVHSAPPLAFDRPGDAWSPEHLLLAAVEACFLFTLRGVARASRVETLIHDRVRSVRPLESSAVPAAPKLYQYGFPEPSWEEPWQNETPGL